jgi:hypothetical protein
MIEMLKRVLLALNILVLVILAVVINQQHQKIGDYRSLLYSQLAVINVPIERILTYHEQGEYEDDENQAVLTSLKQNYADIFNNTGGGLQYEPDIRQKYFLYYNEVKIDYTHLIADYKEAKSSDARDNAYAKIKSTFDNYKVFLDKAEKELGVQ